MGFYLYINGVEKYIDHYDPFPDYDRKERLAKRYKRRRSEHFHERW